LLRFRPGLGGVRSDDRGVGALAIDGCALRGSHWRCIGILRPRHSLRRFKLLHRRCHLLLVLTFLGVPLGLQLLLSLETRHLLGIGRGGARDRKAGGRRDPFAAPEEARKVRNPY